MVSPKPLKQFFSRDRCQSDRYSISHPLLGTESGQNVPSMDKLIFKVSARPEAICDLQKCALLY